MWRDVRPLNNEELSCFENEFSFRIHPSFRDFILTHNAGSPSGAAFHTTKRQRKVCWLLDFSDTKGPKGAWAINQRLRSRIGTNRIVIGRDHDLNYILLEKESPTSQKIVVWAHTTMDFEDCAVDLSAFIRLIS